MEHASLAKRFGAGASSASAQKGKDAQRHWLAKGARGGRPTAFDAQPYQGCNVVERGINRLRDLCAVATRDDKRGHNYLAGVFIATIVIELLNG